MRGKPIEVMLANGQKVEIPRVSPFGAPSGIAEKLRYLEDQVRGSTIERLSRKVVREMGRTERLEKMADRCEAFIQHPDTPPEKRDEYFKKMESFMAQIEGSVDNTEKTGEELLEIKDTTDKYAGEVAAWVLNECLHMTETESVLDRDVEIDICRAALGFDPIGTGVKPEGPLAPTGENSSGADGLQSAQAT